MIRATVGQEVKTVFAVWDWGSRTKKSGLSGPDFDVSFILDGSLQAPSYAISEIGTSGTYVLSWTPPSAGLWNVRVYVPYVLTEFDEDFWVLDTDEADVIAMVRRALGLIHENILIDQTVYDADAQLVQARVRIFASAQDAQNATPGGSSPPDPEPIAEYAIETAWDAVNKYRFFRQVRTG